MAAFFLVWPAFLGAQDTAAPAHVAFVEGSASLDREGQSQVVTAGVPFLAGDRLRTDAGRIEALFPDGSALAVDQYSTIELLSPTLLRVTGGRVMLIVSGAQDPASAVRYQIDTPVASASTDGPGEYRVALLSGPAGLEAELAVLRGVGLLRTEQGSTPVRAGERSLARDLQAPSFPQIFNSARFDAFDRWATLRRDTRLGTAQSAQYLPSELQMYGGTFDRYGAWQHEPQYGYVWYPAAAPDWRPYYNGYWSASGAYGWTWIGLDAWGWPTHHYGRWGFSYSRWFWIPARRWAPAWVTWGAAPGYVSWCPLGFDEGPVFAFSSHVGNPWRGWVAVPRTHFGAPGAYVHRYAVPRLPADVPVVLQAAAPRVPRAVPRTAQGTAPRAVDTAVPRAQSRDAAIPRGGGYAAYGRAQSAAGEAQSSASQSPAARRSAGVSVPRSGATPGFAAEQAGRRADGFSQAVGRSPAAVIKQPLADAPAAFRRNPAASIERAPSEPGSRGATNGASQRQTSPWYGQAMPRYGGGQRAAQPGEANDAAAAAPFQGQRRSYSRGPAGAETPMAPMPQSTAPAPQRAMPRWNTPAAEVPSGVQRAQPIYAPPPTSQAIAPRPAFVPSPAARTPGAVPRGYAPSASPGPPPAARTPGAIPPGYASPGPPPSAARAPGAIPRGDAPSASPGPPPAARAPGAIPHGDAPSASPGPPPAAPAPGAIPRGYAPSASPDPPREAPPARGAAPQHAPASRRSS